jgi:hypothetical protein
MGFGRPDVSGMALQGRCELSEIGVPPGMAEPHGVTQANACKSGGRSSLLGIAAPCTSTGMTAMSLRRAAAISSRTKSSGVSSRRRPSLSVAWTQFLSISASSTSQEPTCSSITRRKSRPGSMPAMSMKTPILAETRFQAFEQAAAWPSLS